MTIYLHVGLGKSKTTFIQNEIFPVICKKQNLDYYCHNNFSKTFLNSNKIDNLDKIIEHLSNENNLDRLQKLNNKIDNILISYEGLARINDYFSDPYTAPYFLSQIFDNKVKIIITFRNPISFFNSLYLNGLNLGKVEDIESFFERFHEKDKLNFSYKKIISVYKKYFDDVFVIKVDQVDFYNSFEKLFAKVNNNLEIENTIHKKGLSRENVGLIIKISKIFGLFGLNFEKYTSFIRDKQSHFITKKFSFKYLKFVFFKSIDVIYLIRRFNNTKYNHSFNIINDKNFLFRELEQEYLDIKTKIY